MWNGDGKGRKLKSNKKRARCLSVRFSSEGGFLLFIPSPLYFICRKTHSLIKLLVSALHQLFIVYVEFVICSFIAKIALRGVIVVEKNGAVSNFV